MPRLLIPVSLSLVIVACSTPTSPSLPQFAGIISSVAPTDPIFTVTASNDDKKFFSVGPNTTLLRRTGGVVPVDSLKVGRAVSVEYIEGIVLIDVDQARKIILEP